MYVKKKRIILSNIRYSIGVIELNHLYSIGNEITTEIRGRNCLEVLKFHNWSSGSLTVIHQQCSGNLNDRIVQWV